jgi:hypothetical protein
MRTRARTATGGALRAGLILAAVLACAASAGAEMDHLTGYKIKEAVPALKSTHALQDALGSGNCTLKKAKYYLTGAEKDGGDDPRGGPAGDYICYTAKCELPEPVLPVKDDQLGPHALAGKKVKIVCLPAVDDGCGDGNLDFGEQCDGDDDLACPGECQPDCTCDPCPGGAIVGGFCWVKGMGNSCDAACAAIGKTCDPATITYAGSGGTLANCQAVFAALGGVGPVSDSGPCSDGFGCALDPFASGSRCTSPPTTCAASFPVVTRFCACQ